MLEIIGTGLADGLAIDKAKASRIEVVSALNEGGLTPSYGLVKKLLEQTSIDLAVMIRPHSQSFTYSSYDLDVMREDAKIFDALGIKHLVVGCLDEDGRVDLKAIDYILQDTQAHITFHRAIDASYSPLESLKSLQQHERITHVLTSGGPGKAAENLSTLKQMKNIAKVRLVIGSGVSLENVPQIIKTLGTDIDIHVGTAVRDKQKVEGPISQEEIQRIKDLLDKFI